MGTLVVSILLAFACGLAIGEPIERSFVPNGIQHFTDTATFQVPLGVSRVFVEVWGAGGGGAGGSATAAGFGAGSGAYCAAILEVTPDSKCNVIVGKGGTGGVPGAQGGVGEPTQINCQGASRIPLALGGQGGAPATPGKGGEASSEQCDVAMGGGMGFYTTAGAAAPLIRVTASGGETSLKGCACGGTGGAQGAAGTNGGGGGVMVWW